MPDIFEIQHVIKADFDMDEQLGTGLYDKKIGQRVRSILSFQVIEKTKSYTLIRVNSIMVTPSRRVF